MGDYLLDTHALLWARIEPSRLSAKVRGILADSNNSAWVSVATLWELTIKQSTGKLHLPEEFFDRLTEIGYRRMAITDQHLTVLRGLPMIHRDPFDRMLIAKAQVERIPLLTCDKFIKHYSVDTIW